MSGKSRFNISGRGYGITHLGTNPRELPPPEIGECDQHKHCISCVYSIYGDCAKHQTIWPGEVADNCKYYREFKVGINNEKLYHPERVEEPKKIHIERERHETNKKAKKKKPSIADAAIDTLSTECNDLELQLFTYEFTDNKMTEKTEIIQAPMYITHLRKDMLSLIIAYRKAHPESRKAIRKIIGCDKWNDDSEKYCISRQNTLVEGQLFYIISETESKLIGACTKDSLSETRNSI